MKTEIKDYLLKQYEKEHKHITENYDLLLRVDDFEEADERLFKELEEVFFGEDDVVTKFNISVSDNETIDDIRDFQHDLIKRLMSYFEEIILYKSL